MQEIFEQIKTRMGELRSYTEENIKNHVVVPIFLQDLGYNTRELYYEDKAFDGRCDITYFEKSKPIIIVETKGLGQKNKELRILDKDKKQILDYLTGYEERIAWGILSNGFDYYLFNNDIQGLIDDKIVFHLSLNQKSGWKYVKYFSYENIFDSKVSNFFADIARFKMFWINSGNKESSFNSYLSTLNNFFEFYSQSHNYSSFGKCDSECLCQIQLGDFFAFAQKMNECPYKNRQSAERSYITLGNNYNHIKAFFETLKAYGYIPHHNFTPSEKEALNVFKDKIPPQNQQFLDVEAYQLILDYLSKGRNSFRNIAIFMLCSYYGLKRSAVHKLTWDSINFLKNTITVENRKYKMTELMSHCLQTLHNEKTKNRLKCNEVFVNQYTKGGKVLSENAINDIFYGLRKINDPNHDLSWLCPEKVRECLIQSMFECGYSIESIVYYTGLDTASVSSCLTYDRIVSFGEKRFWKSYIQPKHPFQEVVDNFYNTNIKEKGV